MFFSINPDIFCIYVSIYIKEVICEDCMLKCSPSRGLDCWDPL